MNYTDAILTTLQPELLLFYSAHFVVGDFGLVVVHNRLSWIP